MEKGEEKRSEEKGSDPKSSHCLSSLGHSETLAPPATDLAEEHSLAEAEQTLLADQVQKFWLQFLPQFPG
jgi:hypothetical protein